MCAAANERDGIHSKRGRGGGRLIFERNERKPLPRKFIREFLSLSLSLALFACQSFFDWVFTQSPRLFFFSIIISPRPFVVFSVSFPFPFFLSSFPTVHICFSCSSAVSHCLFLQFDKSIPTHLRYCRIFELIYIMRVYVYKSCSNIGA